MNNYHECQANAAECARMATAAFDPLDQALWADMAAHWRYISPALPPAPTGDSKQAADQGRLVVHEGPVGLGK